MKIVVVSGCFDNLKSHRVRFLQEASRLGELHLFLWSDRTASALDGKAPGFPQEERAYFLRAVRYVSRLTLVTDRLEPDSLPEVEELKPSVWVVPEAEDNPAKRRFAHSRGMEYCVLTRGNLRGFPCETDDSADTPPATPKVIATGCYDWLHSGHVRFFEEASQLGALYVVVGHDANLRLLKGGGHPMFPQEERKYMVQAIRHVQRALITSGSGWMDAEAEIAQVRPDIYVVNEDGDRPEKRAFCDAHGIRYVLLNRLPKSGLEKRQSTNLRGF